MTIRRRLSTVAAASFMILMLVAPFGVLTTPKAAAITCPAGQYVPSGSSSCTPEQLCPSGQSPTDSCIAPVTSCPSGQYYDIASSSCTSSSCTGMDCISKYVDPLVRLLSGLVGIVVVLSIIVAGIQYASAADDPGKVAAAKKRIYNAMTALLVYLFLFGFLQWLLPGGLV